MSTKIVLPWLIIRRIGNEDLPIASFATGSDAEECRRIISPKYKSSGGGLRLVFDGANKVVTGGDFFYYAQILSGEFNGFLVAEEFTLNPETNRYEGIVYNHHKSKRSYSKAYEQLPGELFGDKVIWIKGHHP